VIQADYHAKQKARRSIRHDPKPMPEALVPTDTELTLRLAEGIEYGRRMLTATGDELSRALVVGQIAAVLRSSDMGSAVDRIGMTELKARLMRRPRL